MDWPDPWAGSNDGLWERRCGNNAVGDSGGRDGIDMFDFVR